MNASEGTGKITSTADMTAGFLLFAGAEELNFAGPWEMLSIWSAYAQGPKCLTVTESGREVRCAKGSRIIAVSTSNPVQNWMSFSSQMVKEFIARWKTTDSSSLFAGR